jgi:APA family basic amino acid/polyamine antiporter
MSDRDSDKKERSRLSRRLNTADAVAIGLSAMIGSGVFIAIGPASASAGAGVLIALMVAAFVAYCNATSAAQLAAVYPESGGTYIYGRKQLGPLWGWLAGWSFVVGKLASCAAAALTFGFYLYPPFAKFLALGALVFLTAINYRGIKKTAKLTWFLLVLVLAALGTIVFASTSGGQADANHLFPIWGNGLHGVLQASAILFFAFAGYARIATLGEEVKEPKRTISKAMIIALAVTLIIYMSVAVSAILAVGAPALAEAKAPLAAAVEAGRFAWLSPVVRSGATAATLGVLLSLILGISRTVFSMSANGELPRWLSAVHSRFKVPHHAEIAVSLIIAMIIVLGDVRSAIGFSSFTILLYYAITNASAWKLKAEDRLWPRWLAVLGLMFCIVLAISLPRQSLILGSAVMLSGMFIYYLRQYFRSKKL